MGALTDEQVLRARAGRRLLRPRFLAAAGALLLLAGFIALMGIITAETLYPKGYSTSQNAISDLGATEPPGSVVHQPSATIFNSVMIAAGLLIIGGAVCLGVGTNRVTAAVFTGLTGVGILGVGVFPGDTGNIHAIFALAAFVAGGVAAVASLTVSRPPFSVVSALFGVIALAVLILYLLLGDSSPVARLGIGGEERWIVYPITAWVMSFGGYLMGKAR
jgi:hypothetical membrane protein